MSGNGLGIFVAPYIAIARQTSESFRTLTRGLGIDVLSVTDKDGVSVSRISGNAQIIVVTPERLEVLLNSGLNIDSVRCVVFDEAHLIDSGVRGARLESLITRFRLRQLAGILSRLILMSAALDNVASVRDWLDVAENRHHKGEWRPTARRVALWEQSGRLSWVYGTDPVRPQAAFATSTLGFRHLPLVEQMYATELFAQMRLQWPAAYKNVAYLVDQLRSSINGPALVVCMTRRATRGVALALAERFDEVDFGAELQALEGLIVNEGPHLFTLLKCLRHGVAYHNASLPSKIRAGIENAVKSGELRAVASTTTLAEGADLPFRLTVLYDWLQGQGESQRPMSPLLFRNIAGRAGRAGTYVEGDTIIFENVLGRTRFTRSTSRGTALTDLISTSPRLRSPYEDATAEDRSGVAAAFEAAFIASIPENPNETELVVTFARESFSPRVGFEGTMRDTLQRARKSVLAPGLGGPIGIAASPIQLTPFGVAVRATGLSVESARTLMAVMPSVTSLEVDDAIASLLISCGDLPEQNSHKLRDITRRKKNSRFVVKASDIAALSRLWRTGAPLIEMFLSLPAVSKSKRKNFGNWKIGEPVPDWDAEFDAFLDFMESAFGKFVPLIANSADQLAPFCDGEKRADWLEIAGVFENRLDLDASDSPELLFA